MAMRRVDEFDGMTDAEVVEFSVDGTYFEIDLSSSSKAQLIRDLERYINAGRRVTGKGAKRSAKKSTSNPTSKPAAEQTIDLNAIRDWAKSTGRKVSDRGRIPRDVVNAFQESHAPNAEAPMFSVQ